MGVPGFSRNLVVKSLLTAFCGFAVFRQLNQFHQNGPDFFFKNHKQNSQDVILTICSIFNKIVRCGH